MYKGCQNHKHKDHKGKTFVKKFQRGCFRASCKHCWLRKWLARESNRATTRIENFMVVKKSHGFREPQPIHIIVSPPWKEKFDSFDVLKKRCREIDTLPTLEIQPKHKIKTNRPDEYWLIYDHRTEP